MNDFRRRLMMVAESSESGECSSNTPLDYVLMLSASEELSVQFRQYDNTSYIEYQIIMNYLPSDPISPENWLVLADREVLTVPIGGFIILRGHWGETYASTRGIGTFSITGRFLLSGNIMALLYGDNAKGHVSLAGMPYVFSGLFRFCSSLELVLNSFLPATELAPYCYNRMFMSCINLGSAPELPAEILLEGCYKDMFNGCEKLEYIKADFLSAPGANYTDGWVEGVSPYGIFVKNRRATWVDTFGIDTIPSGWAVNLSN